MNVLQSTYNSNSGVIIENLFSEEEIDDLMSLYQNYYDANLRSCVDAEASISPLTGPLENFEGFADIVSRKERLFECLEDILGKGYQFIGSETINVGNDTHGPHRDYCYKHDVAKILICLNNRMPEVDGVQQGRNIFDDAIDGSFLVFPGSHNFEKNGFGYSQIQTSWPPELNSCYKDTPDRIHLGDLKSNGDYYYPYEDAKARYTNFNQLNFKKGDVIVFSTRAVHALYPQRESHMMHFLGLLFVEDFNQGYNKLATRYTLIEKLISWLTFEKLKEFLLYVCLPANSEIIGQIMREKKYPIIPKPKGIQRTEIINNPTVYSKFNNIQIMHKIYSILPNPIKSYLLSHSVARNYFFSMLKKTQKDLECRDKILRKSRKETSYGITLIQKTLRIKRKLKSIFNF